MVPSRAGGLLPREQSGNHQTATPPNGKMFNDAAAYAKYAVFVGALLFVIAFFGFAFWHFKIRQKKGKQPLWYHAWMVRRSPRPPMLTMQPRRPTYNETMRPQAESYNLPSWQLPPPPPAYNTDIPPAYIAPKKDGTEATTLERNASSSSNPPEAQTQEQTTDPVQPRSGLQYY